MRGQIGSAPRRDGSAPESAAMVRVLQSQILAAPPWGRPDALLRARPRLRRSGDRPEGQGSRETGRMTTPLRDLAASTLEIREAVGRLVAELAR
jgi:hypothetical protein